MLLMYLEGLEQVDSLVEDVRRKVKGGGHQLLLSVCLCWIPLSASRGQGRYVVQAGSLCYLVCGPGRASPAKIPSSGDGAHVREREKAVMLWCKPVPIASMPVGTRVVMLEVFMQLFPGGRSQPDPAPQGQRVFCWWVKGAESRYP